MLSSKIDCTPALKAKDLTNYVSRLSKRSRENKFIFSLLTHSTTDSQKQKSGGDDKNIAEKVISGFTDKLTMGASTLFSFGKSGLNFILPGNLFWDKIFMIMATSKSYVDNCDPERRLDVRH